MPLDDDVRDFVRAGNFAALTTLFADGQPQTQIMWVDADDEHVLINTQRDRAKFRNVTGDPRVTVTVWDQDSPYRYVELRGQVTDVVGGDEARDHIDVLSQRYVGTPWTQPITGERALLRITPQRVYRRGV